MGAAMVEGDVDNDDEREDLPPVKNENMKMTIKRKTIVCAVIDN